MTSAKPAFNACGTSEGLKNVASILPEPMAANRSGLQTATICNLAMAWVLTLPVAILLSGTLFWIFVKVF